MLIRSTSSVRADKRSEELPDACLLPPNHSSRVSQSARKQVPGGQDAGRRSKMVAMLLGVNRARSLRSAVRSGAQDHQALPLATTPR